MTHEQIPEPKDASNLQTPPVPVEPDELTDLEILNNVAGGQISPGYMESYGDSGLIPACAP